MIFLSFFFYNLSASVHLIFKDLESENIACAIHFPFEKNIHKTNHATDTVESSINCPIVYFINICILTSHFVFCF